MAQTDLSSINKQKNASAQTSCVNQKDQTVQTGQINMKDSSAQYDKSLQFRNFSTQTDTDFFVAENPRVRRPTELDDLPELDLISSKPRAREDISQDSDMPLTQEFFEELIDDAEDDFVLPVSKSKKSDENSLKSQLLKPLAKMMDDGYFLNKNLLYAKPSSNLKQDRTSTKTSSTTKDSKGKLY